MCSTLAEKSWPESEGVISGFYIRVDIYPQPLRRFSGVLKSGLTVTHIWPIAGEARLFRQRCETPLHTYTTTRPDTSKLITEILALDLARNSLHKESKIELQSPAINRARPPVTHVTSIDQTTSRDYISPVSIFTR